MAGKIFVNYRRDDDPSGAARVRDGLAARFGRSALFMDVDNLLAGQRFDEELAKALKVCDVLIAVIGPRWMDLLKARTATDERDYVREEIAAALERKIVVIPVRVGRDGQLSPLPRSAELPEDIRDLLLYQKHDLVHERFSRDITELAEAITTVRRTRGGKQWSHRRAGAWIGAGVASTFLIALVAAYAAGVPIPWPTSPTAGSSKTAFGGNAEAERQRQSALAAQEEQKRAAEAQTAKIREEEERQRQEEQKRAAEADATKRRVEAERQAALRAQEDRQREAEAARRRDEAAQRSSEERRVALVVGNSKYQVISTLRNPVKDAAAIHVVLHDLGFKMHVGHNLSLSAFQDMVREFILATRNADIALLFYAGHGIQYKDQNYLLPTDIDLKVEKDIVAKAIPLNRILEDMGRTAKASIVFLDACRDSPDFRSISRSSGQGGGLWDYLAGLARIPHMPGDRFVGYAAAPGKVASDGTSKNSPFTTALLRHIGTPDVEIGAMFTAVRRDVVIATRGEQHPEALGALQRPLYLKRTATVR